MTTVNYYRVYCSTDSKYEYVWGTEEPTTCPVNTAHTIVPAQTTIVNIISEEQIKIKEETTPTNGKYQVATVAFDCPMGTTVYTHSFDFPMNALASFIPVSSTQEGDTLLVEVAPNTTVGALTANASAGVKVFNVSQTVIDYTITGLFFTLTDGVNVDNLGRIKEIDTDNNTITTTYATTHAFSAASPTYCQITSVYADNVEFGTAGIYSYGNTSIGASYVPAGTEIKMTYTNNSMVTKRLRVNFEYFY